MTKNEQHLPLTWDQVAAFRLMRQHLLERASAADLLQVADDMGGAQAQLLSAAHRAMAALPPVARQYTSLTRDRERQAQLTTALAGYLSVLALEARRRSSGVFVVADTAAPPSWRSGPAAGVSGAVIFLVLFLVSWLVVGIRRGAFRIFRF